MIQYVLYCTGNFHYSSNIIFEDINAPLPWLTFSQKLSHVEPNGTIYPYDYTVQVTLCPTAPVQLHWLHLHLQA